MPMLCLSDKGDAVQVAPQVQKLFDYIVSRGTIQPINDFNKEFLSRGDVSKRVQARTQPRVHHARCCLQGS